MIEDILKNLVAVIDANIDWMIVLLVILSGYFQKYYLKDMKGTEAIKTLLLSFAVTTIYLLLNGSITDSKALARFFFSYFAATSMYETVIKPIDKAIKKRIKTHEDS